MYSRAKERVRALALVAGTLGLESQLYYLLWDQRQSAWICLLTCKMGLNEVKSQRCWKDFWDNVCKKTLSSGIHQVYSLQLTLNNTGLNSAGPLLGRCFSIDPCRSNLSCSRVHSLVGYPRMQRQPVVTPGFSTVREVGTANPHIAQGSTVAPHCFFTKDSYRVELISFLHCVFVPLLKLLWSPPLPRPSSDKGNAINGCLTGVPLQQMQNM